MIKSALALRVVQAEGPRYRIGGSMFILKPDGRPHPAWNVGRSDRDPMACRSMLPAVWRPDPMLASVCDFAAKLRVEIF
jgi:hypothetical protein